MSSAARDTDASEDFEEQATEGNIDEGKTEPASSLTRKHLGDSGSSHVVQDGLRKSSRWKFVVRFVWTLLIQCRL